MNQGDYDGVIPFWRVLHRKAGIVNKLYFDSS